MDNINPNSKSESITTCALLVMADILENYCMDDAVKLKKLKRLHKVVSLYRSGYFTYDEALNIIGNL